MNFSQTTQIFQATLQNRLSSIQNFQQELQSKKELTVNKLEEQKQQFQVLIVEIAGFLDDLLLPLVEENPFYWEDFLMYMDNFIQHLETQLSLFTTLSVSSLRKKIAKTSQSIEINGLNQQDLKNSWQEKQKQTLEQTEAMLENLNQQLIGIRHRIEKQKDKLKEQFKEGFTTNFFSTSPSLSVSSLSLPVFLPISLSKLPSSFSIPKAASQLANLSEQTITNLELVKQDIKRLFM